MMVAELTGEAQRHARWEPPDEETTAAAVAELRKIAGGRTDLLAEVAASSSAPARVNSASPVPGTLPPSAAPPEPTQT